MWCVTATQLMWLENWIVYFLSATLSSFISENWQWKFVPVMRDTPVWISYTYFRMYEDFERWFFESKCYTFLFICFTPANRAYRTHKMLMVMIWISLSLSGSEWKCYLRAWTWECYLWRQLLCSILPILARVVWLEFDAVLHNVHCCKVSWHNNHLRMIYARAVVFH